MFHGFFLGVLGGFAAAKLASSCRSGGGWERSHCGGFSAVRGHGCGAGWGGRFTLFRLAHELNLTPEQWHKGRDILLDLRGSVRQGREELRSSLGPLLSILAASEFNAAAAEELARQHDALFGRMRKSALDALAELHRLLTSEQRERLRRFVAAAPGNQ